MTPIVKFKKILKYSRIPEKKTPGAAAYDIYYPHEEPITLYPNDVRIISTGLAMEIPKGWKGEIYSRSSLASKGLFVANQPGKIDSDYRGEVKILLYNSSRNEIMLVKGARIAQFELNPVYNFELSEVDELSDSERGDGGLGSTGVGEGGDTTVLASSYAGGAKSNVSL